jgi:integrase
VICESAVQIKSQMVQKEGTKTEKMRHFPIGPELEHFLGQLRRGAPNDHVFTKDDKPMVYNYFLQSWGGYVQKGVRYGGIVRRLADEGKIDRYRSPYQCRHTMITHCLEAGVPLVQLARWVGNSPDILLKHYAGVLSSVQVPTLLAKDSSP